MHMTNNSITTSKTSIVITNNSTVLSSLFLSSLFSIAVVEIEIEIEIDVFGSLSCSVGIIVAGIVVGSMVGNNMVGCASRDLVGKAVGNVVGIPVGIIVGRGVFVISHVSLPVL